MSILYKNHDTTQTFFGMCKLEEKALIQEFYSKFSFPPEYVTRGRQSRFLPVNSRYLDETREIHGHSAMDTAAGFDRKNAQVRFYYSGFRAVRRRYGELCMVSPAASRRAGFFPCMLCICRGDRWMCQFHRSSVSIPGLSSSTRRLRYAHLRHERASHFPRSDKSTADTDIAKADAESATMNESTIERRYPTRTFFAARNASSIPRRASKLPFVTRLTLSYKEIEKAAWSLRFINSLNIMQFVCCLHQSTQVSKNSETTVYNWISL